MKDLREFKHRGRAAARLLGTRSVRPRVGPKFAFLQLTHACNLACEFCESHSKHMGVPVTQRLSYFRNQKTMDRETALGVVQDLADLGVEFITLSGRGEPAIHPSILEVIEAIERGGMKTQLFTNGVVSRKDFARDLVRIGCNLVSTSVNAACEETFRVACGKSDLENGFEMVTRLVRDLVETRRSQNARFPVVEATFVIYSNNYRDLPNMVQWACEESVDRFMLTIMSTVQETDHLKLDEDARRWILDVSRDWAPRLSAMGVYHNLPRFLRVVREEERSIRTEDNLQRLLPCYSGWTESAIGPDGAVRFCCYCDAPVGNVYEEGGFKNVWRNSAYQKARATSLRMHKTGRPVCEECFTTCNRGPTNHRIFHRLHPFRKVDGWGGRLEEAESYPDRV